MSDLSLIPTDDLLDALEIRFDHMIFSGAQITGTEVDEGQTKWGGHLLFCQGLAASLLRDLQDAERGLTDDDEDDA